jgi:hypothetical protein
MYYLQVVADTGEGRTLINAKAIMIIITQLVFVSVENMLRAIVLSIAFCVGG